MEPVFTSSDFPAFKREIDVARDEVDRVYSEPKVSRFPEWDPWLEYLDEWEVYPEDTETAWCNYEAALDNLESVVNQYKNVPTYTAEEKSRKGAKKDRKSWNHKPVKKIRSDETRKKDHPSRGAKKTNILYDAEFSYMEDHSDTNEETNHHTRGKPRQRGRSRRGKLLNSHAQELFYVLYTTLRLQNFMI